MTTKRGGDPGEVCFGCGAPSDQQPFVGVMRSDRGMSSMLLPDEAAADNRVVG